MLYLFLLRSVLYAQRLFIDKRLSFVVFINNWLWLFWFLQMDLTSYNQNLIPSEPDTFRTWYLRKEKKRNWKNKLCSSTEPKVINFSWSKCMGILFMFVCNAIVVSVKVQELKVALELKHVRVLHMK